MAKEITVPDILLKLSYIFTKDMYLINNRYCIGGAETEDDLVSKCICILPPDIGNLFIDYFGANQVIYFENIKKAKSSYGTEDEYKYVKIRLEERIKKQLTDNKDNLMKIINSIKGWDQFNLNEDQINSIMNDGNTLVLFKDDPEIPDVIISKSIFPLVKSKDFNNIFYSVFKARNLKNMYTLILNYDYSIFQFYNIIYYLKENKKKDTNLKTLKTQIKSNEEAINKRKEGIDNESTVGTAN